MAGAFGSGGNSFGGGSGGGGFNLQALMQMLSGGMQQYQNFVQNPTQSPLYRNQLGGLLKSLQPGEERAQTNLMDMFRSAGNMSSGQYGVAGANLQGELQRNRQVTASQLLGQMFPQMTQALQQPMSMYSSLIQALSQGQGGQGGQAPMEDTWAIEQRKDPWNFNVNPQGY